LVQDELGENDNVYNIDGVVFIVDKKEEKDSPYIDIEYEKYPWGEEFVVTTFC
jgi:hypothetical protein